MGRVHVERTKVWEARAEEESCGFICSLHKLHLNVLTVQHCMSGKCLDANSTSSQESENVCEMSSPAPAAQAVFSLKGSWWSLIQLRFKHIIRKINGFQASYHAVHILKLDKSTSWKVWVRTVCWSACINTMKPKSILANRFVTMLVMMMFNILKTFVVSWSHLTAMTFLRHAGQKASGVTSGEFIDKQYFMS